MYLEVVAFSLTIQQCAARIPAVINCDGYGDSFVLTSLSLILRSEYKSVFSPLLICLM